MSKKADSGPILVREQHSKTLGNGDIYSKLPHATTSLHTKPINDEKQIQQILQLQELTRCSEEKAFFALHDASGDINKAVEFLIEGQEDTWISTGKKAKVKSQKQVPFKSEDEDKKDQDQIDLVFDQSQVQGHEKEGINEAQSERKKSRIRNSVVRIRPNSQTFEVSESAHKQEKYRKTNGSNRKKTQLQSPTPNEELQGWDPTEECREWNGEAIEIINSNASIALSLKESKEVLIEDNIEATDLFIPIESQSKYAEIFSKIATTDLPPKAFPTLPNVPVFLGHRSGCESSYKTTYKFNHVTLLPTIIPSYHAVHSSTFNPQLTLTRSVEVDNDMLVQIDSLAQPSLSLVDSRVSSHSHVSTFALDSTSSTLNSILEAAGAKELMQNLDSVSNIPEESFCENQFPSPPVKVPKTTNVSSYENPTTSTNQFINHHLTDVANSTSHYNFKGYVDDLSNNITNLVINEHINNASMANVKNNDFSNQAPTSVLSDSVIMSNQRTEIVDTPFITKPISPNAHIPAVQQHPPQQHIQQLSLAQPISQMQTLPSQINKSVQPMVSVTVNKMNTPQHHQQPVTAPQALPQNLPMLSQFPPGYPLFNLSAAAAAAAAGNSGVDYEQLNFLHQQRILYELQQQQQHPLTQSHQIVTTSSTLINPNSDSTASINKTISHSGQPSMTHSNTGIRPDMIPQMGHGPQVVAPAPSYYHYPLVLMNGYPNAFLGQGNTGNQPQSAQSHQNQPSTIVTSTGNQVSQQVQLQQPMSTQQLFAGLKSNTPSGYPSQLTNFSNPTLSTTSGAYDDLVDPKYNGVGFKPNGQQTSGNVFVTQSGNIADVCKPGVNISTQSNQIPSSALAQPGSVVTCNQSGLQVSATAGSNSGFPQTQHQFNPSINNQLFGFYSNSSGPACVTSVTGAANAQITGHHLSGNPSANMDLSQNRPSASVSQMNAMVAAVYQQHQSQHHGVDLGQATNPQNASIHGPPPILMGVHANTNQARLQHHR